MPTVTPPTRQEDQAPETPLTLAEHLEELRRRLGIAFAALLVSVALAATQATRLVDWLQRPAESLLPHFAFFAPTEPLMAYITVSVLAGACLAMPVLLWQVWAFVRSGLTPRERALGRAFVWWGTFQFLAGVLLAYYVLVPVALRVLLGIGRAQFEPVISIGRYLAFVTGMVFWCGLAFELPVVLALLASVGIVTSEWLRQQRPLAVLSLVIVAAIVTPTTDPINLLLMAVPLVGLYELSIVVTRWAMPRRPAR
jgi:sec-independent protein translocase protein TatC